MTMQQKYHDEIIPKLQKELGLSNPMACPRLTKIVINVGVKEALDDKKVLDKVVEELTLITGQKPMIRNAKKSIAAFKIRQGSPIGAAVTLRGKKMYDFIERVVNIVLPRTRDFRGIDPKAVDKGGNLNIGIKEHTVFPEISPEVSPY